MSEELKGSKWSKEEHILAFNLYCQLPFSKIKYTNDLVISLSETIGRTPSSVAFKLVNFARLDPSLQKRGVKGMGHGAKGEIEVWNEFYGNWEDLITESKCIFEHFEKKNSITTEVDNLTYTGKTEGEAIVKTRLKQSFFRRSILASFNNKCCITGIDNEELLVASHIIPWSVKEKERVNPHNGLLLNNLHDKAFDHGLMTITPKFKIQISSVLLENKSIDMNFFTRYHGETIEKPTRFLPDKKFLEYHNKNVFRESL